jgi:hypothetical protein
MREVGIAERGCVLLSIPSSYTLRYGSDQRAPFFALFRVLFLGALLFVLLVFEGQLHRRWRLAAKREGREEKRREGVMSLH